MTTPIITKNQDGYLRKLSIGTAKEKFEVFSKLNDFLYKPDVDFSIEGEEEYQNVIRAIIEGKWTIDSGKFYIYVSELLGLDSKRYLKKSLGLSDGVVADRYEFVPLEEATLFEKTDLENIKPIYSDSSLFIKEHLILKENQADKKHEEPTEAAPVESTVVATDGGVESESADVKTEAKPEIPPVTERQAGYIQTIAKSMKENHGKNFRAKVKKK